MHFQHGILTIKDLLGRDDCINIVFKYIVFQTVSYFLYTSNEEKSLDKKYPVYDHMYTLKKKENITSQQKQNL